MITNDEKRGFFRMMVDADVVISDAQGAALNINGKCRDLSATGLALELDQAISEGETIQVKVASGGTVPPLTATVRVVRSKPMENGNYDIGGEILEMA